MKILKLPLNLKSIENSQETRRQNLLEKQLHVKNNPSKETSTQIYT